MFQRRAPARFLTVIRFHHSLSAAAAGSRRRAPGRRRGGAEAKPEAAPLGGYAVRGLYGDRRSLAVERRPVSDLGFAYVSAPHSARLAHDDQIRSDEL